MSAWAAAPSPAAAPPPLQAATCGAEECEHPQCEVADVGGELICRLAGGDYTVLSPAARDHYAAIAFAAFVAMWETAVEVGMTADVETIPEEPPSV